MISDRIRQGRKSLGKRQRRRHAYRMFKVRADLGDLLKERAEAAKQDPNDWIDNFLMDAMNNVTLHPDTRKMLEAEAHGSGETVDELANGLIVTAINLHRRARQSSV